VCTLAHIHTCTHILCTHTHTRKLQLIHRPLFTTTLSNTLFLLQTLSGTHEHWKEQLSNYQSAHIDYLGSDALSTALAVYLGPLTPEMRLEFINHHWNKCLRERGIELNWSSTEKVLVPSVTDEVGEVSTGEIAAGEAPTEEVQEGQVPNTTNDDVTKHDGE